MTRFTEPALGKCSTCSDQLLSVPGRNHEDSRRIICVFCLANNYEDLVSKQGTVVLTREEVERCAE